MKGRGEKLNGGEEEQKGSEGRRGEGKGGEEKRGEEEKKDGVFE